MDAVLNRLADTVANAQDLESLTRPILELLEAVTGMESTYLTSIDIPQGRQDILYARNGEGLQIPEGLSVPWEDTLCKRALDEDCRHTDAVDQRWGDSDAARKLGIKTYLSQPVRLPDGELYGTLCAAGGAKQAVSQETVQLMNMCARLIAFQVERERLLTTLQQRNVELSSQAVTDPLTGVANRRGLLRALGRVLTRLQREGGCVQIAFIDLDGFKAVNDRHGHEAGDRLLQQIAQRLSAGLRPEDLVGRWGGDEFIVASDTPDLDLRERVEALTRGRFDLGGVMLDYGGGSVGLVRSNAGETDADALLARADAAMYEIKQRRKARQ